MNRKDMHTIGFFEGLPIESTNSFINAIAEIPEVVGKDLLVKVNAVSVNPIDSKIRKDTPKRNALRVIGYDAVGEVIKVGDEVKNFKIGDRIFYAGTTTRHGSNQEFQLVDERLVALAPDNVSNEEAASLPLTSLTASELLFEKFGVIPEEGRNHGKSILVINGAGGVGSILTQLANWAGLETYATSNPNNFDWLKKNGVVHPIDYHGDLKENLRKIEAPQFDYIAVLFDITLYFDDIKNFVKPFGHVGTIVGINEPLDLSVWKDISVSFDWEYMFAKTDNNYLIDSQGETLKFISSLVENGRLVPTLSKVYDSGINADNLKRATKDVETGHMLGKVVVSGPF